MYISGSAFRSAPNSKNKPPGVCAGGQITQADDKLSNRVALA
jgi:hypothetical protein